MFRLRLTRIILTALVIAGCNLSDDLRDLGKGWVYVKEGPRDKAIIGGDNQPFIPCEVIDYNFNDAFIIAKQRPTDGCFAGTDKNSYPYGRDSIYYWIIIHSSNKLLGPLSKQEFTEYKQTLGLELSFEVE